MIFFIFFKKFFLEILNCVVCEYAHQVGSQYFHHLYTKRVIAFQLPIMNTAFLKGLLQFVLELASSSEKLKNEHILHKKDIINYSTITG